MPSEIARLTNQLTATLTELARRFNRGTALAELRHACGLNQQEIAVYTGIPLSRVQEIEEGQGEAPCAIEILNWMVVVDERDPCAGDALLLKLRSISDLPEFVTVKEACAWLRRSRNVVYKAVKAGQLPSVRIAGKKIAIPKSALIAKQETE
jgi:excisionase family DNA binding protein